MFSAHIFGNIELLFTSPLFPILTTTSPAEPLTWDSGEMWWVSPYLRILSFGFLHFDKESDSDDDDDDGDLILRI